MYIFPVILPQVSNREDFLLTVSLFDDDTGNPIALSGTTVAGMSAFTSSAWTVTDGSIMTTSSTQLTIPVFPIGGTLLSVALTVGTGLGILAGDPITIADTATGKNSMVGYVLSYNSSTGALICQIGLAFEFEIRRKGRYPHSGSGYSVYYDIGVASDDASGPLISAQLGNGITIIDVGFIQINIPVSIFQKLHANTHLAALQMTDSVNTRQVFVGDLPVQYGGVITGPQSVTTPASWANQF